jgi:hypothetical protein
MSANEGRSLSWDGSALSAIVAIADRVWLAVCCLAARLHRA